MKRRHRTRLALSCDDAPSIGASSTGVWLDPARLDGVRASLERAGVTSCVAFVIGQHARAHLEPLSRWLAAGYELGNHTENHAAASGISAQEFTDSLRACDQLLEQLGSFRAPHRRWFRFPYLDRGADAAARRELAGRYRDAGYTLAPASVDLFDHCYEEPLAAAITAGDEHGRDLICERYADAAVRSVQRTVVKLRARGHEDAPLIAYFHAGEVSARALDRVLEALVRADVEWCSLDDALEHPMYRSFSADYEQTGLVLNVHPWLSRRALGRLARASERLALFEQARLGPRWPELYR